MGYSATAYDIAIASLVRKYGGKRRELTMRLEELDKFRGVREGNANDLKCFAELLDTLIMLSYVTLVKKVSWAQAHCMYHFSES